MTFDQMLDACGAKAATLPTRERAAEAVHHVLAALGRQLTGDERVGLAQGPPLEAGLTLTAQILPTPGTSPAGASSKTWQPEPA